MTTGVRNLATGFILGQFRLSRNHAAGSNKPKAFQRRSRWFRATTPPVIDLSWAYPGGMPAPRAGTPCGVKIEGKIQPVVSPAAAGSRTGYVLESLRLTINRKGEAEKRSPSTVKSSRSVTFQRHGYGLGSRPRPERGRRGSDTTAAENQLRTQGIPIPTRPLKCRATFSRPLRDGPRNGRRRARARVAFPWQS